MADSSFPSVPPQEGGDKNRTNKKASEKRAGNSKKNFVSANRDKRAKPESSTTITGLFIVIIEIAGLVLWQMADVFHGWKCDSIHWVSINCFVAGAAISAHKVLKKPMWVWGSYAAICVLIGFVIFSNSSTNNTNLATSNSHETNSTKLEEPAAVSVLAEKLQSTSDLLSQVTSQRDEINAKLIAAQSATEARKIKPDQRNKFIALLSDAHASKISIPIIVGNKDGETENFAEQFREMLTAAGYGKDAPKNLPPPKENMIWVTNQIGAAIPPVGAYGNQEIVNYPGLYPASPSGKWGQKNVEVLAVLSDTNGISPSLLATFMAMKATPYNTNGGEVFAYHPTDNPNAIIMGICNALVENGISIGFMPGKGILPDGGVAFFIPQKFY